MAAMLREVVAQALFIRGSGLLEGARPRRALAYLTLAARLASSNAGYFGAAALAASKAGDTDAAVRHSERALQLEPGFQPAHDLLFGLFLHGEPSLRVLERIHRHLRPRTYVEIGVETGRSLQLAAPETLALGVDPQPQLRIVPGPNVRVFAEP